MNITYKSLIRASVAASSLFLANQALAADAPADDDSASNRGDIIVTARRIEERLQDVPISVSVVSQEQISKANITSTDDLARIVPGLNVDSRYTSETNAFSIRGFSQALRTSSSVGTFFGDVVAPRGGAGAFPGGDGAGPGNLFDLQNVQVLKGPQGTLFGRNTTGGSVILTPQKPTDVLEGYVEGSYGNYSMHRLQGVINLPLADWARLRLGADYQKRDGFINNVSGIGPSRFNDINYYALRGSLVLDLSPDIENYTIVSYSNSDHVGAQPQMYRANPNNGFGRAGAPQVARLLASGDPYQVEQTLSNPRAITKQFQVINTTKWAVNDNLTIKNIIAYSTFKQGLAQSVFGSNFKPVDLFTAAYNFVVPNSPDARVSTSQAFNEAGTYGNNQNTFVEEFQIQGRGADGKLDFQTGLYYEHSTPGDKTSSESIAISAICAVGPYTGLSSMRCLNQNTAGILKAPATVNVSSYTMEYINLAAYAQATYAVTDQLKLTGGIRLTWDRTRGTSEGRLARFIAGTNPDDPASLFVPATITGCQAPTHTSAPNCTIGSDVLRTSNTKPTWTLNATYSPSPDMMLYATYARGYRQGAALPSAAGIKNAYDPETVDNFELGVKTSFRGDVSGHFNLTGFYSKLKDAQQLVGILCTLSVCPAGSSSTNVFNPGRAHIWGMEFDGSLRPSPYFRVDFSGAYIKSSLDELKFDITPYLGNFNTVQFTAKVGDPLPFTPEFSGNVSATFTLPIDESLGTIELSATYRYTSSFNTVASNGNDAGNAAAALLGLAPVPVDKTTPVKQLDLNFDWRNVGGQPIDFSIFAANVTNQTTYNYIQSLYYSFGFDVRYIGQPRTYGARLKVRF